MKGGKPKLRAAAARAVRPSRPAATKPSKSPVRAPVKAKPTAPAAKAAPAAPKAPAPPPPRAPVKPVASASVRGVSSSGSVARGPDSGALRIGDDLPALVRPPLSRVDVARYCGASGHYSATNLDEPFARAAGLPSVAVPGGFALGLAGAVVGEWLRDTGRVLRLGARVVKMMWPGDELTARARVSDLRAAPGGREIDLDVWVENQKGELVLRGLASCYAVLPPGVPARPEPPPVLAVPVPQPTRPVVAPVPTKPVVPNSSAKSPPKPPGKAKSR